MSIADTRVRRLLAEFRHRLALDLSGMTIATEAGSGPFLYSPLAAALAGADRVIAVAPDSRYATHSETAEAVSRSARAWSVDAGRIHIVASRNDVPAGIDVFMNLGFLRPLDRALLARGSERAVVSYCSEAWEYRPGDLDLDFCQQRGISVAGVNENFDGFGVFDSCGSLALKLLFEAGIEVAGCRIAVLSGDPFGEVIERALVANGADAVQLSGAAQLNESLVASLDALVVASFSPLPDVLAASPLPPQALAECNPALKIVAFAGSLDVAALAAAGVACHPAEQLAPYRMARTLSHLGVRPVVALHSLGLKVGELLCRQRGGTVIPAAFEGLLQPMRGGG
jgi:hypothetical protein